MRTALLFAAVAAFASPAAAEPFDNFKALCLDADSSRAATEQTARSMNWFPAPAEMMAEMRDQGGPEIVGFVSRDPAVADPEDGEFVIVSRGVIVDPASRQVDIFVCMTGGLGDFNETRSRLDAALGAGTGGVDDEGVGHWIYTLTDGVPEAAGQVAAQGEDAIAEFTKHTPIYLVNLTNDGDGALGLMLGVMRTPN